MGAVAAALAAGAGLAALPGGAAAAPPKAIHVAAFSAPSAVPAGERTALSGRVAPAAPVMVLLQRLRPNGAWEVVARVRAGRDGRFAAALPLPRSTSLRAAVKDREGDLRPSRRRAVTITRRVALTVRARPYEAIAGHPLDVEARVSPGRRGERLLLQASSGRGYRTIARLRPDARGHVRTTVRAPEGGGTFSFRLIANGVQGQTGAGADVTPALALHSSNPHGTPRDASHYIVQVKHEFQLYYYEGGSLMRVFPVVFGAPWTPTPLGSYRVYSKTAGPGPAFGPLVLWYHRGYGIHGTNQEYLLDDPVRYYSHGCTRNYNDNIRWLWPRVPIGTVVRTYA